MAAAIQFDTLDYAKKLATAGVPVEQAEAQAKILGEALTGSIAFPGDLVALEHTFTARMTAMESRLDAKFGALESRLDGLDAKFEALESRLDTKLESMESRLETKIEALRTELKLDLGGKIERVSATVDTLKWMFGLVAALNIGILLKLMLNH